MGCDAVVARHNNLSFCVAFHRQFTRCLIVLLPHCQFGGDLDRKGRYSCRQVFKYLLDVTIDKHINHRGNAVIVFFADGFEVGVHYRYLDLVACFLLDKPDYRRTLCCCREILQLNIVVVAYTLASITPDKEYIAHLVFKLNPHQSSRVANEIWWSKIEIRTTPVLANCLQSHILQHFAQILKRILCEEIINRTLTRRSHSENFFEKISPGGGFIYG